MGENDFEALEPDLEPIRLTVNVATWLDGARTALAADLAARGIPYSWMGAEVSVAPGFESELMTSAAEIDDRFGAAGWVYDDADDLPDGDIRYVDLWSAAERAEIGRALVSSGIPHRWDDTGLVVSTSLETRVDEIVRDAELRAWTADREAPREASGGGHKTWAAVLALVLLLAGVAAFLTIRQPEAETAERILTTCADFSAALPTERGQAIERMAGGAGVLPASVDLVVDQVAQACSRNPESSLIDAMNIALRVFWFTSSERWIA